MQDVPWAVDGCFAVVPPPGRPLLRHARQRAHSLIVAIDKPYPQEPRGLPRPQIRTVQDARGFRQVRSGCLVRPQIRRAGRRIHTPLRVAYRLIRGHGGGGGTPGGGVARRPSAAPRASGAERGLRRAGAPRR